MKSLSVLNMILFLIGKSKFPSLLHLISNFSLKFKSSLSTNNSSSSNGNSHNNIISSNSIRMELNIITVIQKSKKKNFKFYFSKTCTKRKLGQFFNLRSKNNAQINLKQIVSKSGNNLQNKPTHSMIFCMLLSLCI
jgi:hypothetical protein